MVEMINEAKNSKFINLLYLERGKYLDSVSAL